MRRNILKLALIAGVAANIVAPVASANFLTSPSLPAWLTHSRSGNAMLFDSAGKLTYAPNNLLTYSNTFSHAVWSKGSGTITNANAVSDPFGGTQASTYTAGTANDQLFLAIKTATNLNSYITTFWVRRRSGSGTISMYTPAGDSPTPIAVDDTWRQFYRVGAVNGEFVYPNLGVATSGDQIDIYASTVSQVTYETVPRAADQVITTSAAYYGPRFDYDPATLAAKGLLIEEARTNLISYSNAFTSGSWADSGVAPVQTGATDPTGGANSWTLTASGAGASLYFPYTTVNGSTYTNSIWMRRRAGTGTITLCYPNNTNLDVTSSVTSSWTRVNATSSVASTTGFLLVQLGTAGDKIDVFGAQAELASFATSYIPTGASSVTRAADNVVAASLAAIGGFDATKGALAVEVGELPTKDNLGVIAQFNTTNYYETLGFSKTDITNNTAGNYFVAGSYDGTATAVALANTANDGGKHSMVVTWGGSTIRASLDGGGVQVGTRRSIAPTKFNLGSRDAIYYINGHVRRLAFWRETLPDATLQSKSVVGAPF